MSLLFALCCAGAMWQEPPLPWSGLRSFICITGPKEVVTNPKPLEDLPKFSKSPGWHELSSGYSIWVAPSGEVVCLSPNIDELRHLRLAESALDALSNLPERKVSSLADFGSGLAEYVDDYLRERFPAHVPQDGPVAASTRFVFDLRNRIELSDGSKSVNREIGAPSAFPNDREELRKVYDQLGEYPLRPQLSPQDTQRLLRERGEQNVRAGGRFGVNVRDLTIGFPQRQRSQGYSDAVEKLNEYLRRKTADVQKAADRFRQAVAKKYPDFFPSLGRDTALSSTSKEFREKAQFATFDRLGDLGFGSQGEADRFLSGALVKKQDIGLVLGFSLQPDDVILEVRIWP